MTLYKMFQYLVNKNLDLVCDRLGTPWRVFVMHPQGRYNIPNVTIFGMMKTLRQMAINGINAEILTRIPDCCVDTRPSVIGYVDLKNDSTR